MPEPLGRRMAVLDLMTLVAATATSLWLGHEFFHCVTVATSLIARYRTAYLAANWTMEALHDGQPFLTVWTLTFLVLMLRRPRPSLRRLACRPGFIACCAVALMAALGGPMNFAQSSLNLIPGVPALEVFRLYLKDALSFRGAEYGVAVAAAWMTLALGRHSRCQSGWLDRAGQVLGFIWVAMIPLELLVVPNNH